MGELHGPVPGESRPGPRLKYVLAAGFVLALVAAVAFGPGPDAAWAAARERLDDWRSRVDANPAAAAAVFFLLYTACAGLSLPTASVLSLLAGALFGRWAGTLISVTAATAGGTLAFLAARHLFRDAVRKKFGPRLAAFDAGVERDGGFYLLGLRLLPVVPFFLINLGMGLTPMRTRLFAAVSWAGMLPGAFVFVNAGTAAANIASPRDVFTPELVLSLAAVALVPVAGRLAWRYLFNRKS